MYVLLYNLVTLKLIFFVIPLYFLHGYLFALKPGISAFFILLNSYYLISSFVFLNLMRMFLKPVKYVLFHVRGEGDLSLPKLENDAHILLKIFYPFIVCFLFFLFSLMVPLHFINAAYDLLKQQTLVQVDQESLFHPKPLLKQYTNKLLTKSNFQLFIMSVIFLVGQYLPTHIQVFLNIFNIALFLWNVCTAQTSSPSLIRAIKRTTTEAMSNGYLLENELKKKSENEFAYVIYFILHRINHIKDALLIPKIKPHIKGMKHMPHFLSLEEDHLAYIALNLTPLKRELTILLDRLGESNPLIKEMSQFFQGRSQQGLAGNSLVLTQNLLDSLIVQIHKSLKKHTKEKTIVTTSQAVDNPLSSRESLKEIKRITLRLLHPDKSSHLAERGFLPVYKEICVALKQFPPGIQNNIINELSKHFNMRLKALPDHSTKPRSQSYHTPKSHTELENCELWKQLKAKISKFDDLIRVFHRALKWDANPDEVKTYWKRVNDPLAGVESLLKIKKLFLELYEPPKNIRENTPCPAAHELIRHHIDTNFSDIKNDFIAHIINFFRWRVCEANIKLLLPARAKDTSALMIAYMQHTLPDTDRSWLNEKLNDMGEKQYKVRRYLIK